MKFLAIILSTIICLLVVQPTSQLFNYSLCQEEHCDKFSNCEEKSDKSEQNDCCNKGICNPFQVCACCVGGIISWPVMKVLRSPIKANLNHISENDPVLGFKSNCYHPPEIF